MKRHWISEIQEIPHYSSWFSLWQENTIFKQCGEEEKIRFQKSIGNKEATDECQKRRKYKTWPRAVTTKMFDDANMYQSVLLKQNAVHKKKKDANICLKFSLGTWSELSDVAISAFEIEVDCFWPSFWNRSWLFLTKTCVDLLHLWEWMCLKVSNYFLPLKNLNISAGERGWKDRFCSKISLVLAN